MLTLLYVCNRKAYLYCSTLGVTTLLERGSAVRRFVSFLLLTLLVASPAQAIDGFLHADGQAIVDGQGQKVLLRGMGLGGWMLQEGYMLQLGNLGQQHVIRQKFTDLIGVEDTQAFYDAWLANHTTKADIDAMARWGFNSVRLPMHYNLFTLPIEQEPVAGQNTWLDKGFVLTDALLAWCKANNIYLILDLHAAPGGQGSDASISDRDSGKPALWQSPANQQKMIAFWRKLAERYANEPWIGGYDIINEPNWGFTSADDKNGCKEEQNAPLKALMVDITKAIREVDKNHLVIIEGNCWGNNYKGILPVWDSNMVLSFHKYWNFNTEAEVQSMLQLREKYSVPLWLGESGENSNMWFADAIRLVESKGIGWAFWPLKKIGFNNPLQIQPNSDYQLVVDYLNGNGQRPSSSLAKKALMQLAQKDIRFENNTYHPDVIDAMFRQPHSFASLPFAANRITVKNHTLNAVDYDMGVNSYFDTESANYHVSLGAPFLWWNKGRVYRNDGVDIAQEGATGVPSYFVDNIEAGEWLQYTINLEQAGDYTISVKVRAPGSQGRLFLRVNNEIASDTLNIPPSAGWQLVPLARVALQQGNNRLQLNAIAGGFQLLSIVIDK